MPAAVVNAQWATNLLPHNSSSCCLYPTPYSSVAVLVVVGGYEQEKRDGIFDMHINIYNSNIC